VQSQHVRTPAVESGRERTRSLRRRPFVDGPSSTAGKSLRPRLR
jgi:hypothetical protein